jgi:hypothetical protein
MKDVRYHNCLVCDIFAVTLLVIIGITSHAEKQIFCSGRLVIPIIRHHKLILEPLVSLFYLKRKTYPTYYTLQFKVTIS